MSADLQERDSVGRKRSHCEYQEACDISTFHNSEHIRAELSWSDKENDVPFASAGATASSPAKFGCSPHDGKAPSLNPNPTNLPAQSSAAAAPVQSTMSKATIQKATGEPPKKKRLTAEEKAAKAQAAEAEKRKKEEEKVAKAQAAEAEKRKKEEEKAAKAQAAEAEKRRKEEEKAAKAQAAEAEKRRKEEEREKKRREKLEAERLKAEERRQRAEEKEKLKKEKAEAEAKKERSQLKLTAMFSQGVVAAKPPNRHEPKPATGPVAGPSKEVTLYDQMFKPFFIKEHVRLAKNPHEFSEEAREAVTKILDEYILGQREHELSSLQSDPLTLLQIPRKVRRGRIYPSVKKIMMEYPGSSSGETSDLSVESQNAQIRHTMEALKSVPVKSIKFKEDVRPPYIGTISGPPPGGKSLQKLARKPISKDILSLNYDYDSEAEWEDEEGEDVDSLDDEEEEDGDEDMADFLDDSEDVGPARMVLEGGMEPESTGLCWEDYNRSNSQPKMYKYRLEFIIETLDHHHSIDPFSTHYWEAPKPKPTTGNDATTASVSSLTGAADSSTTSKSSATRQEITSSSVSPADAFQALGSTSPGSTTTSSGKKPLQPLAPKELEQLKELVRSKPNYTKVAVIEVFASEHPNCSRARIKKAFDTHIEKSGKLFKVKGE